MEKIRVLIVDGHYMFLKGLESIISDDPSFEVVGEARNGNEAYETALSLKPDVIVMDIDMPEADGMCALKKIRNEWKEASILLLTLRDNEQDFYEAIKNGAKGYLSKLLLPNELLAFIRMVHRGEYIFSSQRAGRIIEALTYADSGIPEITKAGKKSTVLTKREKEVLSHVTKGMSNREISSVLFISENTVKNHIRNIMDKLKINNRTQAAAYAMKEGWLQSV